MADELKPPTGFDLLRELMKRVPISSAPSEVARRVEAQNERALITFCRAGFTTAEAYMLLKDVKELHRTSMMTFDEAVESVLRSTGRANECPPNNEVAKPLYEFKMPPVEANWVGSFDYTASAAKALQESAKAKADQAVEPKAKTEIKLGYASTISFFPTDWKAEREQARKNGSRDLYLMKRFGKARYKRVRASVVSLINKLRMEESEDE